MNYDEVVKKSIQQEIAKATVNILIGGQPKGTGFFITPDGYILTVYHCIGECPPEIRIKTSSGRQFIAKLDQEKTSVSHDIAILNVETRPSRCLPLGLVSSHQVSDEVVSLGYPGSDRPDNQQLGFYPGKIFRLRDDGKIETDAVRGGGQSGGPLYHYESQRVVGVVTEHYWSKEVQQSSENKLVTAPPKVLAGLVVQLEPLFEKWPELQQVNSQVTQEWDKFLKEKNTASHGKSVYVKVAMATIVIGFITLVALLNFRHSSIPLSTTPTSQPEKNGTIQPVPLKEPSPKESPLVLAAGGKVVGYISGWEGTPETFILKRQEKTLPIQVFALLQTGDQIIVTGDSRLELVLVDGNKVEVTKVNSPYAMVAVEPEGETVAIMNAIKALFETSWSWKHQQAATR